MKLGGIQPVDYFLFADISLMESQSREITPREVEQLERAGVISAALRAVLDGGRIFLVLTMLGNRMCEFFRIQLT